MQQTQALSAPRGARLYHGWLVVAAAFLVATFGWGLGFYGPGIYLAALSARGGWPTTELAPAITAYYLLSATLIFFWVGPLFDRLGARAVVSSGAVAMACGVMLLTPAERLWQVYAAFAVMSLGWATMSGAAVNIIVAPWFDRRRGLAVSGALNGASTGGIVFAPLLTALIARFGFALAIAVSAAIMLALLVPVAALVLRPKRREESDAGDGAAEGSRLAAREPPGWRLGATLRQRGFIGISLPFALGLTAQVGFLTHQMAYLAPLIGTGAAGWAIGATAFAAILGRIATGFIVDHVDRRAVSCANFLVQALAMTILATTSDAWALFLGCVLFGLGVGNVVSLPGLIVQREFPREHFSRVVSLVVAINQFTFAFGPSLLGEIEYLSGGYGAALLACLAMQVIAAVVVVVLKGHSPRG
jgi:MFS family permease